MIICRYRIAMTFRNLLIEKEKKNVVSKRLPINLVCLRFDCNLFHSVRAADRPISMSDEKQNVSAVSRKCCLKWFPSDCWRRQPFLPHTATTTLNGCVDRWTLISSSSLAAPLQMHPFDNNKNNLNCKRSVFFSIIDPSMDRFNFWQTRNDRSVTDIRALAWLPFGSFVLKARWWLDAQH